MKVLFKNSLFKKLLPDIVVGDAGPAGKYCWKNFVKCSFHPVFSKVHYTMYKLRTNQQPTTPPLPYKKSPKLGFYIF